LDGHSLYVIEATPRQGYQPQSRTTKVLAHIRGKLWVDTQDYHVLKAEVEVVDTFSWGLFLVRVAKGSRAAFAQTLVNDEVWLPSHVLTSASARLGLLKVLLFEQEISYGKGREFQTDSTIVSAGIKHPQFCRFRRLPPGRGRGRYSTPDSKFCLAEPRCRRYYRACANWSNSRGRNIVRARRS